MPESDWTPTPEFWNESYINDHEHVTVKDHVVEPLIENLKAGSALDLGCGTGEMAVMLVARGWKVHGIDWAEQAIKMACDRDIMGATFEVADITGWVPNKKYDLVISTYSLPGGSDTVKVLDVAARSLRSGGTLIVVEWDRSMAKIWDFDEADLVTPKELADSLEGFSIRIAEVREIINMFSEDDPRAVKGRNARIAVLVAEKW